MSILELFGLLFVFGVPLWRIRYLDHKLLLFITFFLVLFTQGIAPAIIGLDVDYTDLTAQLRQSDNPQAGVNPRPRLNCGDGVCLLPETYSSCPTDCKMTSEPLGGGTPNTSWRGQCQLGDSDGDGKICDFGETPVWCPADCWPATAREHAIKFFLIDHMGEPSGNPPRQYPLGPTGQTLVSSSVGTDLVQDHRDDTTDPIPNLYGYVAPQTNSSPWRLTTKPRDSSNLWNWHDYRIYLSDQEMQQLFDQEGEHVGAYQEVDVSRWLCREMQKKNPLTKFGIERGGGGLGAPKYVDALGVSVTYSGPDASGNATYKYADGRYANSQQVTGKSDSLPEVYAAGGTCYLHPLYNNKDVYKERFYGNLFNPWYLDVVSKFIIKRMAVINTDKVYVDNMVYRKDLADLGLFPGLTGPAKATNYGTQTNLLFTKLKQAGLKLLVNGIYLDYSTYGDNFAAPIIAGGQFDDLMWEQRLEGADRSAMVDGRVIYQLRDPSNSFSPYLTWVQTLKNLGKGIRWSNNDLAWATPDNPNTYYDWLFANFLLGGNTQASKGYYAWNSNLLAPDQDAWFYKQYFGLADTPAPTYNAATKTYTRTFCGSSGFKITFTPNQTPGCYGASKPYTCGASPMMIAAKPC